MKKKVRRINYQFVISSVIIFLCITNNTVISWKNETSFSLKKLETKAKVSVSKASDYIDDDYVHDEKNRDNNANDNFVKLVKLFLCCNHTQNKETNNKVEIFVEDETSPDFCGVSNNDIREFDDEKKIWNIPQTLMSNNAISTRFLLEDTRLYCKNEFRTKVSQVLDLSKNWFYPNGYLRVNTKDFYAPDEFCIERFTKDTVEVKVCPPECGKTKPCIPKCCSLDHVFSVGVKGIRGCQQLKNTTHYFNPPLYSDFDTKLSPNQAPKPHYFLWKLKDFKYNCFENRTTLFPLSDMIAHNLSNVYNTSFHAVNFRLRQDGALLFHNPMDKKCHIEPQPKRFLCFDGVEDYGRNDEIEPGFQNSKEEYIVHLCTMFSVDGLGGHENQLVYGVLLLCAAIFPMMTSGVYISIWKQQNVQGHLIASTTGALFLMYLFQGIALVLSGLNVRERIDHIWGCRFTAIVGHFSFLAAFSWMTVLSADLYLTLMPMNTRSKGHTRYFKYSLFGWGLPTCFVCTGLILDYYYSGDECTPHLVPGYGQVNCWVLPNSQGVYHFYPVAILLSLNFFFFSVTCFKLLRYRENTRFATKKETDHFKGFTRFTKLFLVMGVSWVVEVIGWSIDGTESSNKWYWMIFDVINIMRGVAVFVVYVCKPDILQLLEENHNWLKKLLRPFKRRCSNEFSEQASGSTVLMATSPTYLQPPQQSLSNLNETTN